MREKQQKVNIREAEGGVARVLRALVAAGRARRQVERTSSEDALARQHPIGTGVTEAAAKTVVGFDRSLIMPLLDMQY